MAGVFCRASAGATQGVSGQLLELVMLAVLAWYRSLQTVQEDRKCGAQLGMG